MLSKLKKKAQAGFTLIELMIVVVILGVLAAMSVPLFAAVRTDVKRTATDSTVQGVQKAVDMYKLQIGELPDLTTGWAPLLERRVLADRTYGPWLSDVPRNFLASGDPSKLIDGAVEVDSDKAAFVYDYAGGKGSGRVFASVRTSH